MSEGITFHGIFVRASTTIDGGWRLSFDVSMDEAAQVLQLSQMKDSVLQIAAIPIEAVQSDEPGEDLDL